MNANHLEKYNLTESQVALFAFMVPRRFEQTNPYEIGCNFGHDYEYQKDLDALGAAGLVDNIDNWTFWVISDDNREHWKRFLEGGC